MGREEKRREERGDQGSEEEWVGMEGRQDRWGWMGEGEIKESGMVELVHGAPSERDREGVVTGEMEREDSSILDVEVGERWASWMMSSRAAVGQRQRER